MKVKKDKTKPTLQYLLDLARVGIGFILGWAFFDKWLGLGFSTCAKEGGGVDVLCESAWASGGSPTTGFLQFGVDGPFSGMFNAMAGVAVVDWMFMLGLLLGGVALILGIGVKIATVGASILFFMMWLAVVPTDNNPVLSDHLINILVLLAVLQVNDTQKIGFGKWWRKTKLVKQYGILE